MKQAVELSNYLQPGMVEDIEVQNKSELLEHMINTLVKSDKVTDPDMVRKAIFDREKGLTTGIGHGIAIPHARTQGVTDFIISVARLKHPIEFGSEDKVPVSLVFLIVATDKQDDEYIRLLSRLVLRLRNDEFLEQIYAAENSTEVYNLIRDTR